MEVRLATVKDLPIIEELFLNVVENMYRNGVTIWNEYYPIEEFPQDIKNKSLYVVIKDKSIVAAFALLKTILGQDSYEWENKNAKAIYLSRLGVNINNLKQGVGTVAIELAKKIAKQKGADFLRLSVVDVNQPAIKFYKKIGFNQVRGEYIEAMPETNLKLRELGFEIKVS